MKATIQGRKRRVTVTTTRFDKKRGWWPSIPRIPNNLNSERGRPGAKWIRARAKAEDRKQNGFLSRLLGK